MNQSNPVERRVGKIMTMDDETPAESLRAWAKGVHPIEAGTELLIRVTSLRRGVPG